jgi:general secretion pathway protein F
MSEAAWFSFVAIARSGETVRGRVQAADAAAAIRGIQALGHLPVSAVPVAEAAAPPGGDGRAAPASGDDLMALTRELALLLDAGQPVERALALLAAGLAPRRLRGRLQGALTALRGGGTLADALQAAGGFPPVYTAMLRAGEAAGALPDALQQLVVLLERQARLRAGLLSALLYPAVLAVVALLSVLLILLYVVPQFAPLFERAPVLLPMTTRWVLAASAGLRSHGALLLVLLAALLLAARGALGRPGVARRLARRALGLPLLGPVLAMAAVARVARLLAVLLRAGTPLVPALGHAVAAASPLAPEVIAMRDGVKDGRGLAASLPAGHRLPSLAAELLQVGEESGRLGEVLFHLADGFEQRVETHARRLLALAEPACILAIAVLVGGIVVSLLTALVSLNALAT